MPKWLQRTVLSVGAGIVIAALFLLISTWAGADLIRRLDEAGIILGYVLACLAAGAAIAAFRFWRQLFRWLRRFREPGPEALWNRFTPIREHAQAMLIPLSNREQAEWILRHLKPERVSFLYTATSRDIAQTLASEFGPRGVVFNPSREQMERGELMLEDAHNAAEARRLVAYFLRRLRKDGFAPEKTIVDTTGGTKPMSIALFAAAEEAGVSSIYVLGTAPKEGLPGSQYITDPEKLDHGDPRFLSDRTGTG